MQLINSQMSDLQKHNVRKRIINYDKFLNVGTNLKPTDMCVISNVNDLPNAHINWL